VVISSLLVLVVSEFRKNLEGVGTEVITLSLEKGSRETFGSVTVEEGEGGGESGSGDTPESTLSDDSAPSRLSLVDGLVEEVVEEKVLEVLVLLVSVGDVTEEDRSDDASSTPHESDTGVVEGPLVLSGSLTHKHESLSVRDNLGSVKSLLEVIDELLLVTSEGLDLRSTNNLGGANTFGLDRGEASSEDGFSDKSNGHSEVESVDGSPLSGTLLGSGIEDLGNEGSTIFVVVPEDFGSDFDQVGIEDTLVPGLEDISDFTFGHSETTLEDIVSLGDELHVTVLDTVVNHLDVVTSSRITNPVAARLTIDLSGSLLEDLLDVRPGSSGTSGHEGRTVTGTLLTSRNTGTNEEETLGLELLGAADRVGEVRVSSIDDDVSLLEMGFKLTDEVVDSLSSLDEKDDLSGSLEFGAKLLNGVSTNDGLALGLVVKEVVDLADGTVVGADSESLVSHVEDKVLTHNGKTDESDISDSFLRHDSSFGKVLE